MLLNHGETLSTVSSGIIFNTDGVSPFKSSTLTIWPMIIAFSALPHRAYWKASEYCYWILYYSIPLISDILPPLYVHHYYLLVCSLHILLQATVKEDQIRAAEQMLDDFYVLLPELYGDTSCTLNAHLLTNLTMYVQLWGPLWTHSLFGFENYNGHITSMIHSKHKVAEQLSFSLDTYQVVGNLADKLVESENDQTLNFLSPLSSIVTWPRNMTPIMPGVYAIGKLQPASFTHEEISAIQRFTGQVIGEILVFKNLYFNDTILRIKQRDRKRDSSTCCYKFEGNKHYGIIQQFCFLPPMVLLKPCHKTGSSLLQRLGDPA